MLAQLRGSSIVIPGLATAHSHAFQRGLRGRTQRRQSALGSFWSWREGMYRLAETLDPDSIYALSHLAFVELALAGVTAVGEFHYLHHQPDGTPYDDRTELAEAVIRAARDAGLRISLLRVLYHRAGAGRAPEGAQRRFSDADLDTAMADVVDLHERHRDDEMITVGLAPHSIRAVPIDWIEAAAAVARERDLAVHMHVAEQRKELEESIAELGQPPIRALSARGIIDDRFVAVHATHLEDDEVAALGRARASVCVCRTTERDLGDGLCRSGDLVAAGVSLCTGVDSHAISDPFEEARAIELDERSRTESRHAAADASVLLEAATGGGYRAIGLDSAGDQVELDADDPALVGAGAAWLDDAVIYSASPRAVRRVRVGGELIVDGGEHPGLERARDLYRRAMIRLMA